MSRLRYDVTIAVPRLPRDSVTAVQMELHRRNRRLGVIVGGPTYRLLGVADNQHLARPRAVMLVLAALESVGVEDAVKADLVVEEVRGKEAGPPAIRSLLAPEDRDYRTATLPDGSVLRGSQRHALDDWVIYVEGAPDRAKASRWLVAMLRDLFELPFGDHPWLHGVVAELSGHETPLGLRFACPCCEHLTLEEPPTDTYAICPVCWWEDDGLQYQDPSLAGGANTASLLEARETYARIGVCEERLLEHARSPLPEERRP